MRFDEKKVVITGGYGGIGQSLVELFASDDSTFVTGQVIVIDGGRTSKLPLPF